MANDLSHITCDVAVIGAGLAGLAAAVSLVKKGLNVQVLERESRVGGRVWTHHKPDGSHFEWGAFSFSDSERTLWKLVAQHGLVPTPHSSIDREFIFEDIRGRFSEKASSLIEGAPDVTFADLLTSCLEKISDQEDISLEAALVKSGVSEKVVRWLESHSLPGLLGEGFSSISTPGALQYFRQYASSKKFYAIKGGNDQIPMVLAKELGDRVHCRFQITKVEECSPGWHVHGKERLVFAKHIIFAIPVPALQQISITPPLCAKKVHAMEQICYTSCTRISVTAPAGQFGEVRGGVFAISGGWFRDQTLFQRTELTVFNHSFVGKESKRIKQMGQQEQQQHFLASLRNFVPAFRDDAIQFDVHSWDDVEWIRGGYSYFPPQKFQFKEELASPEGSLFFCGEHTSDKSASMNGALESGLRAAFEVLATRKLNRAIQEDKIIAIDSILEIEAYFLKSGKTLVALDIDDTLTILQDPVFQRRNFKVLLADVLNEIMKPLSAEEKSLALTIPLLTTPSALMEEETAELFQRLPKRPNLKALAITAAMGCEIEGAKVEDRRISELQRHGIDFSRYFPDIVSEIVFPDYPTPKIGRSPFYKQGVILTNELDKGEALVHFMKITSWIPDRLVIVDDVPKNLENIIRAMSIHYPHVEVIALLFQADAKFYKVADNQSFETQWNEMADRAKRILTKKRVEEAVKS